VSISRVSETLKYGGRSVEEVLVLSCHVWECEPIMELWGQNPGQKLGDKTPKAGVYLINKYDFVYKI